MRLSDKTNLYFTGLALLVFAIGGFIFYYEIRSNTDQDADERLAFEKERVTAYIISHKTLPAETLSLGDSIAFHHVAVQYGANNKDKVKLSDTTLYSLSEKESEPYRMLKFIAGLDSSQYYEITIFKPLIETDDLTNAIIQAIGITAIALVIMLILANSFIIKGIWKPFYKILSRVEAFDLTKEDSVKFEETTIKEFKELKNVLEAMTQKISADYRSLKEFTENASHELQTPLSIIQSKIEMLIQSENLSAGQMNEVQAVYEAAGRLSRLNQALLLLAKIENRQFAETTDISLNELIEKKLATFDELIKHKNITVKKHLEPVSIKAHSTLADILLSNLIGNATKHNVEGGTLAIELAGNKLSVSNTGNPLTVPPEELFQRFRKADGASESLGLGLAIVKEICNVYGFKINYSYASNLHTIVVIF